MIVGVVFFVLKPFFDVVMIFEGHHLPWLWLRFYKIFRRKRSRQNLDAALWESGPSEMQEPLRDYLRSKLKHFFGGDLLRPQYPCRVN
jgi:hypothetical protein